MSGPSNIRHIVPFLIHEGVSLATQEQAIGILRSLGEASEGVLDWRVERSLDSRKGQIIVENGLFVDESALDVFRKSTRHQEAAEFMSRISDWYVIDYSE